ncbi:MAG: CDP-alcohol phosphatidyltransferase family protein [Bacteroidota bacterium]|nr:CDP-alcohol phosphatidyltransferase family protein [Bacteroidota bacterium]
MTGITLYRIIAAPILFLLIISQRQDIFKWLIAISFSTDAIDGYLARRYKVVSKFGAMLDSIGDDLTIVAAITGIILLKPEFLRKEMILIILLFALFLLQTILALIRYRKLSSFHTYTAKTAAVLQGIFVLLLFFLDEPVYILFHITAAVTVIDLVEEIILVLLLPHWETDVKGLYSIMKKGQSK